MMEKELQSQPLTVKFVTADAGMKAAMSFIIPLLVVVFGAMLLSFLMPMVFTRGKKLDTPLGAERKYGFAGGAICPRCSRPFPIPFLALNLGPAHRFARCPYCGKTGLMRRRSIDELRRAEAAELKMAAPAEPVLSEEEKLRKEIEDSRYHNI
jgi:DNA-directed RNA polymerase subunit RPC12/RpoP